MRNKILISFGPVVLLLMMSAMAAAQSCPGSYITYIVRDEKGRPVETSPTGISIAESEGTAKWRMARKEFIRYSANDLPKHVQELNGKLAPVEVSAMCNFRGPVDLRLVSKGKVMNVTFVPPRLGSMDSRSFLVDSPPFKAGTYRVDLTSDRFHYDPKAVKKN